MNNQYLSSPLKQAFVGKQRSTLVKSFATAGIIFLSVFLLGIATWLIIDSQGSIKNDIAKAAGNPNFIFDFQNSAYRNLAFAFILGAALSIVSMIMVLIWNFRFTKSSITFAYTVITIYSLAQGIGFGTMFAIFQLQDVLYAFLIAGGLFLAMSVVGLVVKDASGLLPWIIGLTLVQAVASIVFIAMYFAGAFNSTFYLWLTVGSVLLSGLYIIYTVWRIRKMDEWIKAGGAVDPEVLRRFYLFFGFILATQLIQLVWLILRLMQYARR